MEHTKHSEKTRIKSKNSKVNSESKRMEKMSMRDMDEEIGNMGGMCKMVSSKS